MRQRAFLVQRPIESLNQASFACTGRAEEQDVKVVRHILIVVAGSVSSREHLELQDVLSNIVDLLAHDLHHDWRDGHSSPAAPMLYILIIYVLKLSCSYLTIVHYG